MKNTFLLLSVCLALSAVAAAEPFAAECVAQEKALRSYSAHARPHEIRAKLGQALAFVAKNASDPARQVALNGLRVSILKAYADLDDFTTGLPDAKRVMADEATPVGVRLDAAEYVARCVYAQTRDLAAADAVYAPFVKMDAKTIGVNVVDLIVKRANLYVRTADKQGAIDFFARARRELPGDAKMQKYLEGRLDPHEADVYGAFNDYRGKMEFLLAKGLKLEALRVMTSGDLSDIPFCMKLAREVVLEDEKGAPEAYAWLFSRDPVFCDAHLAEACGRTTASTNALVGQLQTMLSSGVFHYNVYGVSSPAFCMDWKGAVKVWTLYRSLHAAMKTPVAFVATRNAAMSYAGLRDRVQAIDAAEAGLANPTLKPEERFELELIVAFLKLKGNEAEVAAEAKRLVAMIGKDCPAKERKRRIERAGSVAVLLGDEALARGVSSFYLSNVHVTPETLTYTVKFCDKAIGGIGNWANVSPKPVESAFTRKFGATNMDFMFTDVASGDRGNATQGGAMSREHPVTLQVAADEWGVHFVTTFYDARARQFESGELSAGSYESYLAPGDNQPYMCIVDECKKDGTTFIMNSTYNSPGQRRVDPSDLRRFRSEKVFEDDRVISYMAFSWDSFADHVPTDGGVWNFESVFWGPMPCAWNGTMSIHGRSSWGCLCFEMGEEARVKIMRAQLFKAVNEYKRNRDTLRGGSCDLRLGCIDYWKDQVLGDPEFYDACLKPLVARLDKVAERVRIGMPDADVKEIVEKHFADFRDISFKVDALRAKWLNEKALRDE